MFMIKAKYLLFQNVTYKNLNTHNFIINIHTSLSLKSKKEFKNQKVNQKKKKKMMFCQLITFASHIFIYQLFIEGYNKINIIIIQF